ncbi:hypothetical protein CONCODRAFT_20739 [Conidiobolus coronatus NRRL 28638]|uniref:Uncharacterized protein n=1 Tax=Conidiobolus coronatus (strain ATCC 28846 / CBS 209.66 / NRRL 28638) TaxID=796925 RepID=A0A137NRK5_CONC2|nr:hypothetical protein CONCODRAFT_20739 [Conidiobolus coronatus NRRL 28638]|eukprot:KXN65399.1 hypothetical protein CONCODRAFT_20739 [Conidiobolus coronatus NRRL 28638]
MSNKELELQSKNLNNNTQIKPKKKVKKDKNLLSFQDDDDDIASSSSSDLKKFKMKSSIDTDPKNSLAKEQPIIKTVLDLDTETDTKDKNSEKLVEENKSRNKAVKEEEVEEEKAITKPVLSSAERKEETRLKIKQLEEELMNKANKKKADEEAKSNQKKSFLELQKEKYSKSAIIGKRRKINETDTLDKLFSFQSKLKSTKADTNQESNPLNEKECELHSVPNCQSCNRDIDSNQEENIGDSWMTHKLKFEKDRLGKDLNQRKDKLEDYTVIDPRAQKKN